jgi:hypothetical protein
MNEEGPGRAGAQAVLPRTPPRTGPPPENGMMEVELLDPVPPILTLRDLDAPCEHTR